MKYNEIKEKSNLNQTQPFNINTIKLYRKFSMPNLFPSNKKTKNFCNMKKKVNITRIDSSKTINIGSANKTLLNINNNFQNSKILNNKHDNNNVRKINIKKSTQLFNYFYDNEKPNIIKEKNKVNTNISSNNETVEHRLLYEDIIKMKYQINRLNRELLFLKSTNRKKDEEIRELENYQEEAKYYFGRKDNNIFYKKLELSKEIIKLKNKY